jgi:hypothetical protein
MSIFNIRKSFSLYMKHYEANQFFILIKRIIFYDEIPGVQLSPGNQESYRLNVMRLKSGLRDI